MSMFPTTAGNDSGALGWPLDAELDPAGTHPGQPTVQTAKGMDLLERRHDLIDRIRNCRYLHRLVRAHFDLTVARATMTDDFLLMTELLTDPTAPDHQLMQAVISQTASAPMLIDAPEQPGLSDLSELLQQFTVYERGLLRELEELTQQVVERLKDCPTACLP